MRFFEGRIDQFVDENKTISSQEAQVLIEQYKDRVSDLNYDVTQVIKRRVIDKDKSADLSDLQYKTIGDQLREEDPDRGEAKTIDLLPIIIFFFAFIAVIIQMIKGSLIGALIAFFVAFVLISGYLLVFGNGSATSFYEGTTSTNGKKVAFGFIAIGLSALIPLLFIGRLGTSGAMILMGASVFLTTAVYLLFALIDSLTVKRRKYTEDIPAECIGYVRTVRHEKDHDSDDRYIMTTSPLFEYNYKGEDYLCMYDLPSDGRNTDTDLGPVTISIDPKHPVDIYHAAEKPKVNGKVIFFMIAFALAGSFALYNFIIGDYISGEQAKLEQNINLFSAMRAMHGTPEEREAFMKQLEKQMGSTVPEKLTDEIIDSLTAESHWYYEIIENVEVNEYHYICLEDEGFGTITANIDVENGDDVMIFYSVHREEVDGKIVERKSNILCVNASEHTYTGKHGAYKPEA